MVATYDTRSFYHRNALGSVMEITDMNEAEVVTYRYDPYGAVTITVGGTPQSSDPLGNPWTYTGRFHDDETGLYYYRARYYSPVTGRFLQRDPLGVAAGANLYGYTRNNSTTRRDPFGLDWKADKKAFETACKEYEDAKAEHDQARAAAEAAAATGPRTSPFGVGTTTGNTSVFKMYRMKLKALEEARKKCKRAAEVWGQSYAYVQVDAGEEYPPPPIPGYPPPLPENTVPSLNG